MASTTPTALGCARHRAGFGDFGWTPGPVQRPRVRPADGGDEVPVPAYELFSSTEILGKMAMERMLAGLSTRRYGVGLEPVGEAIEQSSRSTSKSAVSRKFVAMTECQRSLKLGRFRSSKSRPPRHD